MFEEFAVFVRVGEGTDVVRKEMYDFLDKGDRHLVLLHGFYRALGLRRVELVLNSMGTVEDRRRYVDDVRSHLVGIIGELDPTDAEIVNTFEPEPTPAPTTATTAAPAAAAAPAFTG